MTPSPFDPAMIGERRVRSATHQAISETVEYPDSQDIHPARRAVFRSLKEGEGPAVRLRPLDGGGVELTLHLERPLAPETLLQLASHKDRARLILD